MNQAQSLPTRKHLPALDAVRGVAILGVFCYHLLAASFGDGREQLKWAGHFRDFHAAPPHFLWFYPLTFGWLGVSLFFVLSGFVIHYSTLTTSQAFSLRNFYSRRFWRIYPPYAVAMVVFFFLPAHLPQYLIPFTPPTRLSFVTHTLLVQDFSNQTFFLIDPSFWSIATEVQFYLVYPLLLMLRPKIGMLKVLMGVLSFSLAFRLLLCLAKRHDAAAFEDGHLMLWASPMITIFDWTLGAFLADRFAHGRRVFPNNVAVLIIAVVAFLISTLIRPLSIFSFQLGSVLAAVWIERVVWSNHKLSFIQKMLVPLGLCSYSFYLFHQPLLEMMVKQFGKMLPISPLMLVIAGGPLFFAILFGISWVIYQTVEKTSMAMGKRFSLNPRKTGQKSVESLDSGIVSGNGPGMKSEIGNLADLALHQQMMPGGVGSNPTR